MSFSFYVRTAEPPRFSLVVDVIAEPAWTCNEAAPADDEFAEGYVFHPSIAGRSARGIELSFEAGAFQIRILTCSSRADYELALRTADALSRLTGSPIEPEEGDPLAREEVGARFGGAWIDKMVVSGANGVLTMAAHGRAVSMSGAKRQVHVGPRFAAEIEERRGDMTAGEHLLAAMVRLQNIDEGEYYPASILRVTPKGGGEEASFTMAVWVAGSAYLFPAVQFFAVVADDGTDILVPADHGPAVAGGDAWEWLDEKNALVEATPASEWGELVERARRYAVRR